jgi:predicted P-loop ATPase
MKANDVREQTQLLLERSQGLKPKLTLQTGEGSGEPLRLSIIPVSTQKTPYKPWKQYQAEYAPYRDWREHYCNGGYVGIICGEVSDHLEAIDIDLKNDPQKTIWEEYKKLIPDVLFQKLLIQTTPNDGYHIIYRCPRTEIDKNQKLAHSKEGEVILETRGEGGYFCTHLRDYQAIQGRFHLAQFQIQIPEITPEERETLLDLARSLDRKPWRSRSTFQYSEPAIEKFNAEIDLIPLMEEHDWAVYDEDDQKVRLARPGSSAPYSGYYLKKDKVFICFSTSTQFKTEQAYNHFQVLKILKGENDYHKTVKLLPGYGYELEKKSTSKISPDEIAEHLNQKGVRYDQFRQDLIYNGEIINESVYNTLYLDLCKDLGKEVPRSRFEVVIKSLYIDQYHPIREFISKHSERETEGNFEKWVDCLTLKNQDLDPKVVVHFFRKWMIGLVAQALDGPFPNEFFLSILSHTQGIGKTTLLRNYLLPEELREYQAEHSLSFTDDFKVLMGQVLLLIDDELDGRSFEQSQSFKNILSTGTNTTRRKYDRRISSIKRRASFAGSGNLLKVVRERGERRIIPLEVTAIDREKLNKLNLTDMFIEAYNHFQEGFEYSFQEDDKALLDQLYGEHYQESDLDLIIEDMMEHPGEGEDVFYITNLDVVSTLSSLYPNSTRRINTPNVGKTMAEHGFRSKRVGKKKVTTYLIGGESRIIELLGEDCQSWRLLTDMINRSEKHNTDRKTNNHGI